MKSKSLYFAAVACIVFGFNSCKKDLLKQNTNPTTIGADQYDPNLLLTTVQLNYTGSPEFMGENWEVKWGLVSGFIQHTASINTSFYSGDKYLNATGSFGDYFNQAYIYQVQPVVELYELTKNKTQYKNLHQVSRIMKAMVFEGITDLYGDIPYTQGGQGYYQHIFTPAYDKQQDIYTDLLKEVSEATDSLDDNADKPTGDVFYANDPSSQIDKWKRFGYSLQLRMAMRLIKRDEATAKSYATKVSGKTMINNDDNAIVQHVYSNDLTINRDAWEINGQDSTDLKLCSTFIDFFKTNNDPRLPVISWIYSKTPDTKPQDQLGLPPGYILGGKDTSVDIRHTATYDSANGGMQRYSRFNKTVLNGNAPSLILTYAETELLLADASKRFGVGNVKTHYDNGVIAAITQLSAYGSSATISNTKAMAYLTAHPYTDTGGLNQINTQYWACTVFDEYEAWSNWRRTGYPILAPTKYPGNVTGNTIPRRLPYPLEQKTSNAANYNAAVAGIIGGDKLTSHMWWDK